MFRVALFAPLALAAGCATYTPGSGVAVGAPYSAALIGADGKSRGTVEVSAIRSGTRLKIKAHGLVPGDHGLHLHAVGRCDFPGFASAGGHWNPEGREHGQLNPRGPHKGDLPNLNVSANGHGMLEFMVSGHSLADADGTSLVIHARPDDLRTNPSGDSGDRIACAVIVAPQ